jgi:2-C-methyl-D-erythritol 4-phosphate cytidylyltransferase
MTNVTPPGNLFAVVPAAGIGQRMGSSLPKQYLSLLGKTVLEHTVTTLLKIPQLQFLVVVVAADDKHWQSMTVSEDPRVKSVYGGAERGDSVLNGLHALSEVCDHNDWVLVHDVARPCINLDDINSLIIELTDNNVGGLLATPCSDTIKKVQNGSVIETIDRRNLWQAQTPQMFRYQLLCESLYSAIEQGLLITDEASAIEVAGYHPKIVEGSSTNIKITRLEDLSLAEFYLHKSSSVCV